MFFAPKAITLKDGRSATLRSPRREDAQALIDYMRITAGETDFLLRYPDEVAMTVEQEERFIAAVVESSMDLMILCEVDGHIAGNCHLMFGGKSKVRHRATVAITLYKAYWGLGIGTAMFEAMIDAARAREGVMMMELEVVQGNARARALYEKMGFKVVAVEPNHLILRDGTLLDEYIMQKML